MDITGVIILSIFGLLIIYAVTLRYMKKNSPDSKTTSYLNWVSKILGVIALSYFIYSLILGVTTMNKYLN